MLIIIVSTVCFVKGCGLLRRHIFLETILKNATLSDENGNPNGIVLKWFNGKSGIT